jgi:hypothetical protein
MKAKIRGKHYEIPSLNVGQLERLAPILVGERSSKTTFELFKICTERATPSIDDATEATVQEIRTITDMVLEDCGLQPSADPNAAPAPEGTDAG